MTRCDQCGGLVPRQDAVFCSDACELAWLDEAESGLEEDDFHF